RRRPEKSRLHLFSFRHVVYYHHFHNNSTVPTKYLLEVRGLRVSFSSSRREEEGHADHSHRRHRHHRRVTG
ncbi:MAG TPA: hypothetical protein PK196_08270, partial [Methanoculleus sp.]|nr:hypothetical protein [Methanoculleus sp.]